jgi:hypothetical protein
MHLILVTGLLQPLLLIHVFLFLEVLLLNTPIHLVVIWVGEVRAQNFVLILVCAPSFLADEAITF